ncbi:MAG: GIN domain-containing protein [Acidimicrobiia bacterium]
MSSAITRIATPVAIVGLAAMISACSTVVGSGDVITLDIPIEDVSRLDVSHAFDVTVTIGETPSLLLTVDDNMESHLDVATSGDLLRIGIEPRTLVTNATLVAELTVTSLDSINASGASKVHHLGLRGDDLDVELSGASHLDGAVDVQSMAAVLSGASGLNLSGEAASLDGEGSGASDLSLLDIHVGELQIELSGASDAEESVSGTLTAALSGASSLRYRGDPNVSNAESSGASSITQIP